MESERQIRSRTAEEARVCELLGWKPDAASTQEKDMGNIVLGDVNHPAPIIVQQPAPAAPAPVVPEPVVKKGLSTVASILLGMAIPGSMGAGALLNHFLSGDTAPVPVVDRDTSVELGLSTLRDLNLPGNPDQ